MRCPNCEAAMINGVFCHETGCPSAHLGVKRETKLLEHGWLMSDMTIKNCRGKWLPIEKKETSDAS